jgi:hypothetical protein
LTPVWRCGDAGRAIVRREREPNVAPDSFEGEHIMRAHAMVLMAVLAAVLTAWTGPSMAGAHAAPTDPLGWLTPGTSSGSCTFKKTEIAAATSFDENSSTAFVKLGNAGSINFTQANRGCVAGTFFANAGNMNAGDHVLLQVLLDGAACAPLTGSYVFANAGDDLSSHSAAFFCGAGIAPGTHKIQVEYASGLGGNVQFFQRTLEVTHD